MKEITVGYGLCGSFCTLSRAVAQLKVIKELGYNVVPIVSNAVYSTDTRFGTAEKFLTEIEDICKKPVIHSVKEAEPIGPKGLLDIMVVSPCTGNTLSKIANGITDSSVTMAAKAHLRNSRPLLLAVATNDALSGSAKNIGALFNTKNVYFVPLGQDDPLGKPTSLVCDFTKLPQALESALSGEQIQPLFI